MHESVTIMVWKEWITSDLDQIFKCLPVKLSAGKVHWCETINILGVRIRVPMLQHRLNNILVTPKDGLVDWDLAS